MPAPVYSLEMQESVGPEPAAVVAGSDAETYTILSGRLDAGVVILCDHAGNAFPPGYGTLGLAASELERHIAYDVGAAAVTRRLAAALGAPAVLTRYSRLLIDVNRGLDDPTLIMRLSDGAIVTGNRQLDAAERDQRIRLYYEPYHAAIEGLIGEALAAGLPPALLSIHSYTHMWKGCSRPWHAAVLWDKDPRLARPLLEALVAERGLVVGENEPYSGHLKGDSMWRHGTMRGLAHAIVEIRQDLIRDQHGQQEWGERLAGVLRRLLAHQHVRRELGFVRRYGSYTD